MRRIHQSPKAACISWGCDHRKLNLRRSVFLQDAPSTRNLLLGSFIALPMPPDILKYFYEEPVLVEPLTPDAHPDARRRSGRSAFDASEEGPSMPLEALLNTEEAFRGYMAGRNQADDRVGLTALRNPETFVMPLLEAFGEAWWGRSTEAGRVEALQADAVQEVLADPTGTTALVTATAPVEAERIRAAAGTARRRLLPALHDLLQDAAVAFFPEPAHHGHDWSLFSASPLREALVAAFRAHPTDTVRRFVLPYQKARSESKFYFETWQLTEPSLPDYIEEV